jgi:hypothetical protein
MTIDIPQLRALATEARQRADAAKDLDMYETPHDAPDYYAVVLCVASARTDVPALADAVEALAEEVERLRLDLQASKAAASNEMVDAIIALCDEAAKRFVPYDEYEQGAARGAYRIAEQLRALAGKWEGK